MTGRLARATGAIGIALGLALSGCAVEPPASVPRTSRQPSTPVAAGSPTAEPAPSETPEASPSAHAEDIRSYVATAAEQRLFFAHQSVGFNVMKGLNHLSRTNGWGNPVYVDLAGGETVPEGPGGGFIVQVKIGRNGDPLGKIADFDKRLRDGLAGKVNIAALKLCYVDINSGTDVAAIFKKYRTALNDLEKDYPGITFLHATVPLKTEDAAGNKTRTRLNELLRKEYGDTGRLWDIAAIESTDPEGERVGGKGYEALFSGYASDGAHLNEEGGQVVAAELLKVVAHTVWSDE